MGSFGNNLDSPFDHSGSSSSRPMRPRVDPFKNFDALPNPSKNPFRVSFDEAFSGNKTLQSQKSASSLHKAPLAYQGSNSVFGQRKASANYPEYKEQPPIGSAPTPHNLIDH